MREDDREWSKTEPHRAVEIRIFWTRKGPVGRNDGVRKDRRQFLGTGSVHLSLFDDNAEPEGARICKRRQESRYVDP